MAASRTPKKAKRAADAEVVSTLAEQVGGDERARHEREPLGFEEQLPAQLDPTPENDPQYRPLLDLSSAELPTHEGYGLDAATHFRRRRNAMTAAMVLTVVVAVFWVVAVRGQIVGAPQDPGAASAAVSEARIRFDEQFNRITAGLARLTATSSAAANVSAAASLQTAVSALRAQLTPSASATSTSSTPR